MAKAKKRTKTKINCKKGLSPKQELEARRLKRKLLDSSEREKVYVEILKVFDDYKNDYKYETTFLTYLKDVNPVLFSACIRADVKFMIIDRKLIINVGE